MKLNQIYKTPAHFKNTGLLRDAIRPTNLDFSRKEYELEEFKAFIERHRSLRSLFKVFRRNNISCTLPNPQVFIEYCKKMFESNESENTLEFEDSEPFVELDVQDPIFRPIRQEDFDEAIEQSISKAVAPKVPTRMGFEPTRAEPIELAVQRLNHSATSSLI